MAVNFLNDISKYEFSGFPIGFSRNNPIPLDRTEVWLDFEELKTYAASGATAYVGQKVTYVDVANKTATVYIIADEAGTLTPVGSSTEGDEISISLNNGILSLKDFGKRYYEYIAAEGEVAAHYELVEVDDNHPWSAGLTPKIVDEDGALVLGWFEPNKTTIEGVQDQANEALNKAEQAQEKVTEVEDRVDEISDILNDAVDENGETVEGLVTRVDNLETDITSLYDAVDNTYTKEEVDGKIASVFHYRGKKATYADLFFITDMIVGDVWEVIDEKKEYAYNGSEWIELGLTVDLSAYATSEYVDSKAKSEAETAANAVQQNVDILSETVNDLSTEIENLTSDNGIVAGLEEKIDTNKDNIDTLISANEEFSNKITTLERYVGTPSESSTLGALYPVVESLNDRINSFEETLEGQGFGEFNKLETLTINGTLLTPNEAKTIDLPIFAGATSGLVPVANDALDNIYYLNATGEWSIPMDSRVGNLGDFATVVEYVDNAINTAFTWSEIGK